MTLQDMVLEDTNDTPEGLPSLESEGFAPDSSVLPETPGETAPSTEAPAETPAPEPAPTPSPYEIPSELRTPPPAAPSIPDVIQQELEYLRNRDQHWARVEESQRQDQSLRQSYQTFLNEGFDETTSLRMANIQKTAQDNAEGLIQQERQSSQLQANRRRAAEYIGKEKNVNPSDILAGASPDDMYWRANAINHMGDQNKKIQSLTQRLEALEKRSVPDQHMDGGTGSSNPSVTVGNIDSLYVGWETSHPNSDQENPYAARYRALIG